VVATEIVERVKAIDEAEHEEVGEARGHELPEHLRTPQGSEHGGQRYRKRRQPSSACRPHQTQQGVTRLLGRGTVKVRTEWRLQLMNRNLTKLNDHRNRRRTA
jgi:hypothetical protein